MSLYFDDKQWINGTGTGFCNFCSAIFVSQCLVVLAYDTRGSTYKSNSTNLPPCGCARRWQPLLHVKETFRKTVKEVEKEPSSIPIIRHFSSMQTNSIDYSNWHLVIILFFSNFCCFYLILSHYHWTCSQCRYSRKTAISWESKVRKTIQFACFSFYQHFLIY